LGEVIAMNPRAVRRHDGLSVVRLKTSGGHGAARGSALGRAEGQTQYELLGHFGIIPLLHPQPLTKFHRASSGTN
jgi:hypothetical protein